MMNMKKIGFTSALLLSAATAFAAESDQASVASQQKSLLEKLDSLNAAVLGLKLDGTAKAGVVSSNASSDQFSDNSPTRENQAYTDVNLVLTARPSAASMIHLELRLHKDWQSAFDENNNPVIGHWFSYDGMTLDNHMAFNLGYMRIGYTPLTIGVPQQELLQEPEIFREKRVEALAKRNLDTTSRRLMQGVNADYHSGELGFLDDIHMQLTGARMRNASKKYDEVFFDFDYSDRYMLGGRLGLDAYGAHIGGNYVNVFDRKKSTRAHKANAGDAFYYEDNQVISAELGFDSKKILADLPVTFGLFGEFASSKLAMSRDTLYKVKNVSYILKTAYFPDADPIGEFADSLVYLQKNISDVEKRENEKFDDVNGTSFYVEPFVKFEDEGLALSALLKFRYMQNNEKFWSEMAASPIYQGNTVILNANAMFDDAAYNGLLGAFGAASLENLYFTVYNSNPLNQLNIMSIDEPNKSGAGVRVNDESGSTSSQLYNNYKNVHLYRNAYSGTTLKYREVVAAQALTLDPTVSLALPYGVATPDRKGFALSLDVDWNSAVSLNGRFSQYTQDQMDNKYTQYAAGLGFNLGRIVDIGGRDIILQASYGHEEEDNFLKRKAYRIMAGGSVDVWGPIALLGGFQTMTKEFGATDMIIGNVTKAEESLLLVGPRIKIAPLSYISVQYGMLTDKLTFNKAVFDEAGEMAGAIPAELSIDKNVIVAEVTVNF